MATDFLRQLYAPQQQKRGVNPYAVIQKQPALNNSTLSTIPAFGLVRVVASSSDGALLVDQPNADGQDVYVNGPTPIRPDGFGIVTKAFPIWAAYDSTSGTPAIGDTWGAANGSYLLTKGKNGFLIQANPVSTGTPPRVLIAPGSNTLFLTSSVGSATLGTSWGNTGLSVTLPANTTWLAFAQLSATISSSASGAGDYLSFRFYDGTIEYGAHADFCYAVCASITFYAASPMVAVMTAGNADVTINLQGIVNTASGSAGGLLHGYLAAIQLK